MIDNDTHREHGAANGSGPEQRLKDPPFNGDLQVPPEPKCPGKDHPEQSYPERKRGKEKPVEPIQAFKRHGSLEDRALRRPDGAWLAWT